METMIFEGIKIIGIIIVISAISCMIYYTFKFISLLWKYLKA